MMAMVPRGFLIAFSSRLLPPAATAMRVCTAAVLHTWSLPLAHAGNRRAQNVGTKPADWLTSACESFMQKYTYVNAQQ